MGQAAGGQGRDRLHRTVQRVRHLRPAPGIAGHLRPARPRHDPGVLRTMDLAAAAAAFHRRPRRRVLVGPDHAPGRDLPHHRARRPPPRPILLRSPGGRQPRPWPPRARRAHLQTQPERPQNHRHLQDRHRPAKARAVNKRLLDTERVGQGTVLASPAFARIAQSTVTGDGRRAPALRFGDPGVQALAGALANTLFAVTDITNKRLRALMTGLLGTPYSMNQANYDLARLRRNSLITRVPGHNQYTLTPDGIGFAVFSTKVHDRVLRPLLATRTQPHAPPELRAALHAIDRAVSQRLAHARLRTAA